MTRGQAAATVCRIFWLPKQEEDLSLSSFYDTRNSLGSQLNSWHQAFISGQANGSKHDLTA